MDSLNVDRGPILAAGAGLSGALVVGLGVYALGKASGGEARGLVEAIMPTTRFLCSAVVTAASTILALMLTILGMAINNERSVKRSFYVKVKRISLWDSVVIVTAIIFLVLHSIPITESQEIPYGWFTFVYYTLLAVAALLGGLMVSIVVLLYRAITEVISMFGLEEEHTFVSLQSGASQAEENGDAATS